MYTHTRAYTNVCAYIYTDIHIYIYIHIHMYLYTHTVTGSFKAPEQRGHLRLVDPVDLRWQGPDAHSLQMIWDTPASNCDTLVLQYVVSM